MERKACKGLCLYCLIKWLGSPVSNHESDLYRLGPMCRISISLQQAFMLRFTTTDSTKDTKYSAGLSINVDYA